MSVTVELPVEVLARLRAEATRRGVRIDDVITELAEQLPIDTASDAALRPVRTLNHRHFATVRPTHCDAFTLLP
jgi:hypothetical protein